MGTWGSWVSLGVLGRWRALKDMAGTGEMEGRGAMKDMGTRFTRGTWVAGRHGGHWGTLAWRTLGTWRARCWEWRGQGGHWGCGGDKRHRGHTGDTGGTAGPWGHGDHPCSSPHCPLVPRPIGCLGAGAHRGVAGGHGGGHSDLPGGWQPTPHVQLDTVRTVPTPSAWPRPCSPPLHVC